MHEERGYILSATYYIIRILFGADMYLYILIYQPGQVCCRRWTPAQVFGLHWVTWRGTWRQRGPMLVWMGEGVGRRIKSRSSCCVFRAAATSYEPSAATALWRAGSWQRSKCWCVWLTIGYWLLTNSKVVLYVGKWPSLRCVLRFHSVDYHL